MKETISVNLASQAFTFDKDAYRRLKEYLDAIRRRLPAGDRKFSTTWRPVWPRFSGPGFHRRWWSLPFRWCRVQWLKWAIHRSSASCRPGRSGRGVRGCGECLVRQFPALVPFADRSFDRRRVRRNRWVLRDRLDDPAPYHAVPDSFGGLSLWVYIILWIVIPSEPLNCISSKSKNMFWIL